MVLYDTLLYVLVHASMVLYDTLLYVLVHASMALYDELQKYGRTSRVEPLEGRTLHILPVSMQSIQILLSINCL